MRYRGNEPSPWLHRQLLHSQTGSPCFVITKPADGLHRDIGSMFAAHSKERCHVGSSQTCGKDHTSPGSKVKKRALSPKVTFPPLCPEPSCLSSASVPKSLFSHASFLKNLPTDRPLSLVELPRLIAEVGAKQAIRDSKWREGPRLMALALGTDIPVRTTESTAQSLGEEDESLIVTICEDKKIRNVKDGKVTKPNRCPLTGTEVVRIFAQRRDHEDFELYYLKEVDGDDYRPYDLRVVHSKDAGSEHYIFSPNTVLHVTEKGYGGLVSLSEWYREYVLWTALQEIPFFRDFRLHKAFAWWNRNVHNIVFQRKCKKLQDILLVTVPQFRNGLHLFTRVIEELKETHWMPLDDSKTYTLLAFKSGLITKNQDCLQILEKLLQYRTAILNGVKEDSYKTHQKLRLLLNLAEKPNRGSEPIHLHLAHQKELKKELAWSESTLQKLGKFAALIHQMIVQSLVTIIQQDAMAYLNVLKRRNPHQRCFFQTELCFSANASQLTVDPPVHLFKEAVSEALLSAGNSIIQMCDSCGFFLEISNSSLEITSELQSLITGGENSKEMSVQLLKGMSARWQGLPKEAIQGTMVHGCYSPLSRTQTEWQISINDVTKHVAKEQAKIMQETEVEIQKLCESFAWLVDIHSFTSQWGQAFLESLKGQPASLYEEHIQKVHNWAERINTVDSSMSASNKLFNIDCTHTKESLELQLRSIKEDILEQLAGQLHLQSQSIILDLERASAELKTEPQDLCELAEYALMVRESAKMLTDMQNRLEYTDSLRNTICMNYRRMTEQELMLEKRMLGLWDCFVPRLKQADSLVCHRLPSTADALDTMFSFLVCDLKSIATESTSGPFLDPSQNAKEMVSQLNYMCAHMGTLTAKLEQLNRNSQNMQERALDLTIITTDVQKVIARKELWELRLVYTAWLEKWKQLLFSEAVVSQAQWKISKWKDQAQSLENNLPTHDAVLQDTLGILESLSLQLHIMAKLESPTLKEKHLKAIFQDIGLLCVPEKVTVADLMSQQLEMHLILINKICRNAQAECNMEQTFQKLCQRWQDRLFQLDEFNLPVCQHFPSQNGLTNEEPTESTVSSNQTANFIVTGLEVLLAELENDLMILSAMVRSPHSVDFRMQVQDWLQSLKELEELLNLFERYQQMWAFLTKVFGEMFFSCERVDLVQQFQPLHEKFKEMMQSVSSEPHVLNFVSMEVNDRFHGSSFCQILFNGVSTMETISSQMMDLLDALCEQCPRLWFLSEREVIQLISFQQTPLTLQPFICKCFKGVCRLQMDFEVTSETNNVRNSETLSEGYTPRNVLGVFGSHQEHITFQSPLESDLDALYWLCAFDKKLKMTMVHFMQQCYVARHHLNPSSQDLTCDMKARDKTTADKTKSLLDLVSEYPLQCLLVVEEAVWCSLVLQTSPKASSVRLSSIKAYNAAKLKTLGHFIRDGVTGSKSVSLYTMMCLRALVQLTMKHAQQLSQLMEVPCVLESSFEWLSFMKYHISSEDENLKDRGSEDSTCCVDVLGHRFHYGFEYSGPEDWGMVYTPSTYRAALGILLSLTSYRCGLVSGPSMSGKKHTVVQLGRALGRLLLLQQCYPNMKLGVIQRLLLGALQTGSWLLLDSVDILTQGVLSLLGQNLVDIHQSFSELRRLTSERVNKEPEDKTADGDTVNIAMSECYMVLAGKSISASLNYGCILISSRGYSSKIPESLRFATRPIALTHPDYRIIAEVMLTSIGFSDAVSLSQRLVSLFILAKDSSCLPDYFNNDESCFLDILQKIISASEIHLRQNVRQQDSSNTCKCSSMEQADQTSSQYMPAQFLEVEDKETHKLPKIPRSHLSVIQSVREETAIVKAVLSVLIPEHKKASKFYIIFKDTFPIACQFPLFQQYIDEEEKNQLQDEVTEELQLKQLCCDTEILSCALTLYQTMKFSQAIMLIGPTGSGKTTCYSVLAGALNSLAAKAESMLKSDRMTKRSTPQTGPQVSISNWNSVDTLVLFPNAMSQDEMFGYFCEKRGWQDGAVAKILKDTERRSHAYSVICNNKKESVKTSMVKWLIMDGEPVGQPGWLDYFTTLCSSQNSLLSLLSCQTLASKSHLKLVMEMTDLRDASPSAVTHCSIVYFTGTDLWKAVWKKEMNSLTVEHKLDQGIKKMWDCLTEDLFSGTLTLLEQKALTSAIHIESRDSPTYGLQEILSFVRILRALLQHFGTELEQPEAVPQIHKRDTPLRYSSSTPEKYSQNKQELLRDLFLVAYVWGFGGHLHSCHWPRFNLLVREVLFNCRYKIVVSDDKSVFEQFFCIDKMYLKDTLLTNSIIPKYGKYTYLLNIMLKANQPVMLVGEPASGKTTLCKALLSFDRPYISLLVSPLLSSKDLRIILKGINCQRNSKTKQGLLLFIDDLHEAPCDVFGKMSTALETLRQSISKKEIIIFDNYFFKLLSSRTISYMAACCVSRFSNHHNNVVSSRLLRLFSTFVLPSQTMDVILSVCSPWLKSWFREMHISEAMSYCIITATKHLYHAVCDQFQPTMARPHFIFSHHDLQKVFRGMCLWQCDISNTASIQKMESLKSGFPPALLGLSASVLNIVHLWMHECMRTFNDMLCSEDERKALVSLIAKTAATHYGIILADEAHSDSLDGLPTVTSLAVHTLPMKISCTCQLTGLNPDTVNLSPESVGHLQLETDLTSLHSENCSSEEANLKIHPLQPQILEYMENKMTRLVYGPDLSEVLRSMNQQQTLKWCSSYQEQNLDVLLQQMCELMSRKDEDQEQKVDDLQNFTTRYTVHRQRVCQLLHIIRALLIPGGHGILISSGKGTGRKTTVRLAAYLTGSYLMEVHSDNENKLHEILKEAGNQTRVDGVNNVILLVHEEISRHAREELLVAMANRLYPGLYTDEDLRNLVTRVTAEKNSRTHSIDSWTFEKYLSKVHRNVHVFLLMPSTMSDSTEMPISNETQSCTAQMDKALKLSCCVEMYQPWSYQSLVEVAAQCFKTNQLVREGTESSLSVVMAKIHQSACQYASVLLRHQPFSPGTYMEFISHFGYLCNYLRKQRQSKTSRVATVLSHLDVLDNTDVQNKENIIRLQNKVAETQQHEEDLLRAVSDQKSLLDKAVEKCVEEEIKLQQLEEQINHAQKQLKPVFQSGLKILNCLNPSDLEEVRHYRDPPEGVVRILDAICVLFNRPQGWESAKQLIGQSNFFQEMEFFDRYSLTNEQLQQLGLIVHSPQFVPESVREVSKACESLCRWVLAVFECCCIHHQLLAKQQLEVLAKKTQGQLYLAKQKKKEAYKRLEDVKLQVQFVQKDLGEFLLQVHKAEDTERKASLIAGQLEMHVRDWRATAQEAELSHQNVPGDALLLAAMISYLGPFEPDTRIELLHKWKELCQTGTINTNPKDPRISLFPHVDMAPVSPSVGFPIPVTERLQVPLAQALGMDEWQLEDTLSSRLVVKLLLWGYRSAYVQRWPLLADIQQHLEISSQNWLITGEYPKLENETEFGMVICADDLKLLDKLDQAAEKGLSVLVTHIERVKPSPRLLARLARSAGFCFPGLNQTHQLVHPEFCLFLSTHLPVRLLSSEIHASILAQVHVVDLSLSSEETQELMLTQLLQSDCHELLMQHLRFQNYNKLLQKKLVTEQDALMDYILQCDTQDLSLLPRVVVCQDVIKKLQAEIKQLNEELEHHESLLAAYRHIVRLAAALYQSLQAVTRLSPAYHFSLHGFIKVMQEAFTVKCGPLVSDTVREGPGRIIFEIMNRMVSQLLVRYRPCLFKCHAAVLKLLFCLALLQHSQLCSEAERLAFLRGLEDIGHCVTQPSPSCHTVLQSSCTLPSWVSPDIHSELLSLEKISSFRGLIASLCASPMQWQEYLHFPSSTVTGPVPCRSHSHLSLLQRALLWKTMLPNCLEGIVDAINAYHLSLSEKTAGTEAPYTGNPKALSQYINKHKGPIILALPNPKGENRVSIQPLRLISQLASCEAETKQVQVKVITFGAVCDSQLILSVLDKAVNDGHWLVFNNCHLLEQWDDKVVAQLIQLITSFKEKQYPIHPRFQLWFITQENASHSIPAAVRVCALPLACDSLWDLKEELSFSLQQVLSIIHPQSLSGITADSMKLLLRCAIFHSVLLQRQTYKYLGQGRLYHWNQEDLLALVDAHLCIASLCHDKAKALQFLAVNLVHGGQVTDSADKEVVENVAKICLSRVSPRLGSGLHVLSNVICDSGNFDLSGVVHSLERNLQDSENMCEPVMMGFSVDVAAEIIKLNSQNLNIFMKASQTPRGAVRSFKTKLSTMPSYIHAKDRLQALKSYLAHKNDSAVANAQTISHSPLRDLLQAELDDLIDLVSLLLSQLQQPVQYTPTFLLELSDLSRLERRAELLSAYLWHHNTSDPPGAYRLSAFKNARGFLVAVMREAAQAHQKYISDVMLHFEVLCDSTYAASLCHDAVYLCGLKLKGALWDTEHGALQETFSPQQSSMPFICVKTQIRSTDTARDTLCLTSSYLTDTSNVTCAVHPSTKLPVYLCPLYLENEQDSGNWGLADVNIITKVPLPAMLNPVLCNLRRVRLVSTL